MSATTYEPSDWTWWQEALADPAKVTDGTLPVHDAEPFTGFFRTKGKNEPVAFWYVDGALQCHISGKAVSEEFGRSQWTWCCRRPVSHEAYTAKVTDGEWPDEVVVEINGEKQSSATKVKAKPAEEKEAAPAGVGLPGRGSKPKAKKAEETQASEAAGKSPAEEANPRAVIGDNSAGADGIDQEFEDIREEIETWKRELDKLLKDGDPMVKAEADKVSDIGDKLGELWKRADTLRDTRKRPHLEAGRAVDGLFKPVLNTADDEKRRAKRALAPFLKKLQEEENERRRKEDERRRKEAEANAEKTLDDTPPAAAPAPERKAHVGNRRSTGLVKRKVIVVDDYLAIATHLLADGKQPVPDLAEVLRKIAFRQIQAGVEVPGARVEEVEEVR